MTTPLPQIRKPRPKGINFPKVSRLLSGLEAMTVWPQSLCSLLKSMLCSHKTRLRSYSNTCLVPVTLILWYLDFSSIKREQNTRTCPVPLPGSAWGSDILEATQWESVICRWKLNVLIKPYTRHSSTGRAAGEHFLVPAIATEHFGLTHCCSHIEMCFPHIAPSFQPV